MTTLSIDIETYSDVDISLGVYRYVDTPRFEILLLGYAVDFGPVTVVDIKNGEKPPRKVMDLLQDPAVTKTAFNAQFERVCLNKFFDIETENWECTMVKSWYCGINGGLASVGNALALKDEKMDEGKRLIKKFSVPNKNGYEQLMMDEVVQRDWKLFKAYCKRDVEVEMEITQKLSRFHMPEKEWELYRLDQEINDRGIKIDLDLVRQAIRLNEYMAERGQLKYKEITGMDNANSIQDIKKYIHQETGRQVKSLSKDILPDLIERWDETVPHVAEVLRIRQQLGRTSTAKYKTMQEVTMSDGRSRGNIQFYGANRTGRWAGRLIQVHNLPQNHLADLGFARDVVATGDLDYLELMYDDPADVMSQVIRPCIIPEEGKKFIVADFSAIEARVIAWYAKEDWVLDVFRTTGKIYEATASRMFNVPMETITKGSDLRQKGKVATLALGYQGGVGALKAMGGARMGLSEKEMDQLVHLWRSSNKKIVRFWQYLEKACKEAISNRYSVWTHGVKFTVKSDILWITLPSGRELAYAKPRLIPGMYGDKIQFSERLSHGKGWRQVETYGGKLAENIVQATARDCLAHAMLALDDEGYEIVMHVHDEVVIEIDEDQDELEKICALMGEEISWAPELPLRADGYECKFYQKD